MAALPYQYVNATLHERRERVFLLLAALFIGSLAMMNILGVTRFLDMSFTIGGLEIPFVLAVGVLPYPITFLCTDFICEFYGRRRANFVVLTGFIVNLWVVFILYLGGALPPVPPMDPATGLPPVPQITEDGDLFDQHDFVFYRIRALTMAAVVASMIAYLAAQFCDVYLFHFWKRLTRGRHLWLRNIGSTTVSQFVDTFAVITITHFFAGGLPVDPADPIWAQLWVFILSSYIFKLVVAFADTLPFYIGVHYLSRVLHLDPIGEHDADVEETATPEPVTTGPPEDDHPFV